MTKRKQDEEQGARGGKEDKKSKKHFAGGGGGPSSKSKKTSTAKTLVDGDCPEEAIPVPTWADGLPEFKNKEKVLILSSRGITHR